MTTPTPPYQASFIKIPPAPSGIPQTLPTDPSTRLRNDEIRIERAVPEDAEKLAECLYLAFPESWWVTKEPLAIRPPTPAIRQTRLAKRLLPTLSLPHMHWMKAIHVPTSTLIGAAGWAGPELEARNVLCKSTAVHYNWPQQYGWSDEEFEDMWAHTDLEAWDKTFEKDTQFRTDWFKGEPHWYLAPLMTWPGWQGRGVGKKLMEWALEQADRETPVTPLYLESAPHARAVYMHVGFVPIGEYQFERRGPRVVRGLEAEEDKEAEKKAGKETEELQKSEVTVAMDEVVKAK